MGTCLTANGRPSAPRARAARNDLDPVSECSNLRPSAVLPPPGYLYGTQTAPFIGVRAAARVSGRDPLFKRRCRSRSAQFSAGVAQRRCAARAQALLPHDAPPRPCAAGADRAWRSATTRALQRCSERRCPKHRGRGRSPQPARARRCDVHLLFRARASRAARGAARRAPRRRSGARRAAHVRRGRKLRT